MKGNLYTLTVSYDCYAKQGGKPIVSQKKTANIFEHEKEEERLTDKDLKNLKNYEVVGLKELKSFKNRIKKTTHRSTIKREIYTRSQRISSRQSYQQPKTDLLSKEEVIYRLQKSKLTKTSDHLTKHKSQLENSELTDMSRTLNTSLVKTQQRSLQREVSVKKLKERMKFHEQEWKMTLEEYKKLKFPSIFQRIQQFRQKSMQKDQYTLNQKINNIKSSVWNQVLRTPFQMVDIFRKKVIAKTFHSDGEFMARGKSKFQIENQWITRKEIQGYQFKFCQKEPTLDQQKKAVCIR